MAKKVTPKTQESRTPKIQKEEVKTEQTEPQDLPDTYTMFARKKDYGFVAMTQEASMRADETSLKGKVSLPPKIASAIHKIKEDKE